MYTLCIWSGFDCNSVSLDQVTPEVIVFCGLRGVVVDHLSVISIMYQKTFLDQIGDPYHHSVASRTQGRISNCAMLQRSL